MKKKAWFSKRHISGLLQNSIPRHLIPKNSILGTHRLANSVKPTFVGIGFPRCSTTTISFLLASHPEISFPTTVNKELHFFDRPKSPKWYFEQFEDNVAVGEFTPRYITVPESRDRIYDLLGPDVRLIVALRNPVDRAYSHYWQKVHRGQIQKRLGHLMGDGVEGITFEKALELEEQFLGLSDYPEELAFFKHGLYAKPLKWYFQKFPRENFYIYLMEDFVKQPEKILEELCRFLGVDSSFQFPELGLRKSAHTDEPLTIETRMALTRRYESSINELEDLLNVELDAWKMPATRT